MPAHVAYVEGCGSMLAVGWYPFFLWFEQEFKRNPDISPREILCEQSFFSVSQKEPEMDPAKLEEIQFCPSRGSQDLGLDGTRKLNAPSPQGTWLRGVQIPTKESQLLKPEPLVCMLCCAGRTQMIRWCSSPPIKRRRRFRPARLSLDQTPCVETSGLHICSP